MITVRIRVLLLFILLVSSVSLFGCQSLKNKDSEEKVKTESEEVGEKVDTPEDTLKKIIRQINDEMRVFDVNEHHESLSDIISEKAEGLEEDQVRQLIKETVQSYMDAYFTKRIEDVLVVYNEGYTPSDVETVFKSTSRTALYELIELYEWTFFKNR